MADLRGVRGHSLKWVVSDTTHLGVVRAAGTPDGWTVCFDAVDFMELMGSFSEGWGVLLGVRAG
jgi:hypothetical protein